MNPLGVQLQLMIGPTVPVPAPKAIAEALQRVEVTTSDEGRSGFQLVFQFDTNSPAGLAAEVVLNTPLFTVFNRVVLTVIFKGIPHVLIDGIITNQEHQPAAEPGAAYFTLMGEDISLMLDREDKNVEHPAQDETIIALKIIASYAQYGLIPLVIPPVFLDPPLPIERTPVQQGTDLKYLEKMAERHAYVFYITPGPVPLTNTAYWGPPVRVGIPQPALSVNMGPQTNVDSINFQHNALAPTTVSGKVQDRWTNQTFPVQTFVSLRLPLASLPDWLVHRPHIRTTQFRGTGLNAMQAAARAQAIMDRSMDEVVTASGEIDAMCYGGLLRPRSLVGLRGAGLLYDGFYYIKKVTHLIQRGSYKQRFTLAREGLGTTTPVVRP
jgi:hypothetical protein